MTGAQPGHRDDRVLLPVLDTSYSRNPFQWYQYLRDRDTKTVPIRLPGGREAWLTTDYDTARNFLADSRLMKDSRRVPEDDPIPLFRHLLTLDPPDHARLRSVLMRGLPLSPREVQRWRPRITAIATGLLDDVIRAEVFDLVESYALPLSVKVICEMVGVPSGEEAFVLQSFAELAAADLEEVERVPLIARRLEEYLGDLIFGGACPQDPSLLNTLRDAHDRGTVSRTESCAMAFLVLSAGHETTANFIGTSLVALLRDRRHWSYLREHSDEISTIVNELLRFDSSLGVSTARSAACEIAVNGSVIQPGDTVFVGLAAANRDAARFSDPDQLHLTRNAAGHMAFGHGIHRCPGASLARLEAEVALVELSRRFPALNLATPVVELEWVPGLIMRGLRRLPVDSGTRRARP